jgi:hypothetical protein
MRLYSGLRAFTAAAVRVRCRRTHAPPPRQCVYPRLRPLPVGAGTVLNAGKRDVGHSVRVSFLHLVFEKILDTRNTFLYTAFP